MFKVIRTSDKSMKCLEFVDKSRVWYKHNLIHNDKGPAVLKSYKKEWWNKGFKHRINGPAVEHNNGEVEYWIYGQRFEKDEYDEILNTGIVKIKESRTF